LKKKLQFIFVCISLFTGALLVGALFTAQQVKADENCQTDFVSATGKPSSIGELARANSFFTWKATVKEKLGASFMAWSNATERKLVCVDLMSGDHKGKWQCTRQGRPCKLDAIATEKNNPTCQKEIISAYGARKRTKTRARAAAEHGWALKVKSELGDQWSEWGKAQQKSVSCTKKSARQYQCIGSAYACKN